jgi:hypothetical protein
MSKSSLLKGQSTGAPLFLAWVIGVISYQLLWQMYYATHGSMVVYLFDVAGVLGVSTWQALILLTTWWRRVLWVLIFFLLYLYHYIYRPDWWNPIAIPPLVQAVVLFGARRRVWLWISLALYFLWLPDEWWEPIIYLYRLGFGELVDFIPVKYLIGSHEFLTGFLSLIFGAIAAFLMPPTVRTSEANR